MEVILRDNVDALWMGVLIAASSSIGWTMNGNKISAFRT
jgi:hypothetical protein